MTLVPFAWELPTGRDTHPKIGHAKAGVIGILGKQSDALSKQPLKN